MARIGACHRNCRAGRVLPVRLLRSKGYEMPGIELPGKLSRRALHASFEVDVGTESDLDGLLDEVRPDEVYNLAGLSR